VTKARRTGSIWTGFVGRHCGQAKALLVALPLLMLSVLVDHGLAGATAQNPGNRVSQASDVAGTEGKAQLPGRGTLATVDPLRVKPKLSSDGTAGPHGIAPSIGAYVPSPLSQTGSSIARYTAPAQWRVAACPRAPPIQAA
jgi:hypothetical protein